MPAKKNRLRIYGKDFIPQDEEILIHREPFLKNEAGDAFELGVVFESGIVSFSSPEF